MYFPQIFQSDNRVVVTEGVDDPGAKDIGHGDSTDSIHDVSMEEGALDEQPDVSMK